MKFSMGDKIKVKTTGRVGEVIGYKHEISFANGKLAHSEKYYIEFNQYTHSFYTEDQLMFDYEIDPKLEKHLIDMMIDYNLDKRNFELVKYYADLKKKLG